LKLLETSLHDVSNSGARCRQEGADVTIREILQSLGKEYYKLLLEYIRDWNAKPKSCHVAQRVLYELISVIPAGKIVEV
jgi:U3 small nucleolar RNA-associated protein 13